MNRYRFQGFGLNPIWAIIGLNLMLFFVTQFDQGAARRLLGLTPALVIAQPWTILTSMFMHGGFGHIFVNMLMLYFFGSYLLRLVGETKFLLAYFVGGILGNVMFILLGPPFTIAVGASGAVFALGGALAVMRPKLKVIIFPIPVPLDLWIAVIGGFMVISFLPYIAWQAHLGGLVAGLVAGYFFRKKERGVF